MFVCECACTRVIVQKKQHNQWKKAYQSENGVDGKALKEDNCSRIEEKKEGEEVISVHLNYERQKYIYFHMKAKEDLLKEEGDKQDEEKIQGGQ